MVATFGSLPVQGEIPVRSQPRVLTFEAQRNVANRDRCHSAGRNQDPLRSGCFWARTCRRVSTPSQARGDS
jgi:hypothetical protein